MTRPFQRLWSDLKNYRLDLLQSSYKPNFFIRSRQKNSCPRPNAVDGSLIYKGDNEDPIRNQQSNINTRFPHGTEVRFDCLRTELEEIVDTEEISEESDDEENGDEIITFRKKRAIRAKTKTRKKPRNQSNRRRQQTTNAEGGGNVDRGYNTQTNLESSIEDGLKKVKYRSWKIVCNDGRWIGKFLGCDENGHPLLDDEAANVDFNPFNASCPYVKLPKDNLVAFHGDREITGGRLEDAEVPYQEYFEPGAELVFRCKDIGKDEMLIVFHYL